MKIATVLGARPQFIKAAAVSRVMGQHKDFAEIVAHTGQHYDAGMSDIFFADLQIPTPRHNLGVGSAPHGAQTGSMLAKIEEILLLEKPDAVLVYGDTNSTLAGALAAVKLHIPVAHVEAGLRSFNRRMPEEINRELTDRISGWLFCPTEQAVVNLEAEQVTGNVYNTGDVMYDSYLHNLKRAEDASTILADLDLEEKDGAAYYYLATVHRPENTDQTERLRSIFEALDSLDSPVVLPLHPRTAKILKEESIQVGEAIRLVEPLSYLDMCLLEKRAQIILTDSGGLQKEAYFSRTPCITMRDETEWVETVEGGWNKVVGADKKQILAAVEAFRDNKPEEMAEPYGDGTTAQKIVSILASSV